MGFHCVLWSQICPGHPFLISGGLCSSCGSPGGFLCSLIPCPLLFFPTLAEAVTSATSQGSPHLHQPAGTHGQDSPATRLRPVYLRVWLQTNGCAKERPVGWLHNLSVKYFFYQKILWLRPWHAILPPYKCGSIQPLRRQVWFDAPTIWRCCSGVAQNKPWVMVVPNS